MKNTSVSTLLLLTLCSSVYADTPQTTSNTNNTNQALTPTTATNAVASTPTTTKSQQAGTAKSMALGSSTGAAGSTTATAKSASTAASTSTAAPATAGTAAAPTTSSTQPAAPAVVQKVDCAYTLTVPPKSLSHDVITRWASHAATQTFTYDHKQIKDQLKALESCYTSSGWESYTKALKQSGNVAATKKDQLIVAAQPSGKAHVLSQKIDTKRAVWKVSVPLEVVYKNSSKMMKQLLSVKLTIGLKPEKHLGIQQIIASPRIKSDETNINNDKQNAAKPAAAPAALSDSKPAKTSVLHGHPWMKPKPEIA